MHLFIHSLWIDEQKSMNDNGWLWMNIHMNIHHSYSFTFRHSFVPSDILLLFKTYRDTCRYIVHRLVHSLRARKCRRSIQACIDAQCRCCNMSKPSHSPEARWVSSVVNRLIILSNTTRGVFRLRWGLWQIGGLHDRAWQEWGWHSVLTGVCVGEEEPEYTNELSWVLQLYRPLSTLGKPTSLCFIKYYISTLLMFLSIV